MQPDTRRQLRPFAHGRVSMYSGLTLRSTGDNGSLKLLWAFPRPSRLPYLCGLRFHDRLMPSNDVYLWYGTIVQPVSCSASRFAIYGCLRYELVPQRVEYAMIASSPTTCHIRHRHANMVCRPLDTTAAPAFDYTCRPRAHGKILLHVRSLVVDIQNKVVRQQLPDESI